MLSEALAQVNEIRAEYGLAPLERLPKGVRGSAYQCPIAKAFPAGSFSPRGDGNEQWLLRLDPNGQLSHLRDSIMVSGPIVRFVQAFEIGAYPELEV